MVFGNANSTIPEALVTDELVIRPLLATDVALDYAAVMESREFLRKWEQSTWPADDFTLAGNLKDLQRHEREHIERTSFTFTVMNSAETECLGCIYIFPLTARWLTKAQPTSVSDTAWSDYEAVIQFWVRKSRLAERMDRVLLDVLRNWFEQAWDFDGHCFLTNEAFEQQVNLFEEANMAPQVEVEFEKLPVKFLAYS